MTVFTGWKNADTLSIATASCCIAGPRMPRYLSPASMTVPDEHFKGGRVPVEMTPCCQAGATEGQFGVPRGSFAGGAPRSVRTSDPVGNWLHANQNPIC